MKHLALPVEAAHVHHKLPFYLAMEEYAARNLEGNYFFIWQVKPTIIYGRNQVPESEFNIDYCRRNNIEFYRRKSGGGCVYADMSNVMFSHVADCDEITSTFGRYTGAVAAMLGRLGIADASATGRNDILIGNRKVSGYAFYHIKNASGGKSRAIVHGTMLYDADLATMGAVLTPSASKLASKGVASVRQRVTTIREHSSVSLDDFKSFAIRNLCTEGVHTLTPGDLKIIQAIEQDYYNPRWLGTRYADRREHHTPVHIPGVGEISVLVTTKSKRIERVDLTGDFFSNADAVERMLGGLRGVEAAHGPICEALDACGIGEAIPGLGAPELADLIISENVHTTNEI